MKQDLPHSSSITHSHLIDRTWTQGRGVRATVKSRWVGGGYAVEGKRNRNLLKNASPVTRPLCDLKVSKVKAVG